MGIELFKHNQKAVVWGSWISNIRVKRKNPKAPGITLDEKWIRQLDAIGMEWK